jgi:uncharacterized CHY-type Zn-finger protein
MKLHHLINEINQIIECFYCNNDLTKHSWASAIDQDHHYKETICDKCGRKLSVKVNFQGSGHDCWDHNCDFSKKIGASKLPKKLEEEI